MGGSISLRVRLFGVQAKPGLGGTLNRQVRVVGWHDTSGRKDIWVARYAGG